MFMELYKHNKAAHAYGFLYISIFMMEKYVTPHPSTHTDTLLGLKSSSF